MKDVDYINISVIIDQKYEDNLINSINRSDFYHFVSAIRIDLDNALNRKLKEKNDDRDKLNVLLESLYDRNMMSLIECMVFLEELEDFDFLLKILSEKNLSNLKTEVAKKFNIKVESNILHYFLS